MEYYFLFLIPPLIVIAVLKMVLHETISWREMAIQLIVCVVIVGAVFFAGRYQGVGDNLVRNGYVTGKERVEVSCSHSYRCRCRTDSDGNTRCQTCYRHSEDYDWRVYTTVEDFDINRTDSRGSDEPERWTRVTIGEPVARTRGYPNYIKASPETLFRNRSTHKGELPEYPETYDYHRFDHAIGDNADIEQWNKSLAENLRKTRSPSNAIVVFTPRGKEYANALREKWLGGKINDVIVVIHGKYPAIDSVTVFSWAKNDLVNVMVRDRLMRQKTADPIRSVNLIVGTINEHHVPRKPEEFEYLLEDATPSTGLTIAILVLGFLLAGGLGWYFHREDF